MLKAKSGIRTHKGMRYTRTWQSAQDRSEIVGDVQSEDGNGEAEDRNSLADAGIFSRPEKVIMQRTKTASSKLKVSKIRMATARTQVAGDTRKYVSNILDDLLSNSSPRSDRSFVRNEFIYCKLPLAYHFNMRNQMNGGIRRLRFSTLKAGHNDNNQEANNTRDDLATIANSFPGTLDQISLPTSGSAKAGPPAGLALLLMQAVLAKHFDRKVILPYLSEGKTHKGFVAARISMVNPITHDIVAKRYIFYFPSNPGSFAPDFELPSGLLFARSRMT